MTVLAIHAPIHELSNPPTDGSQVSAGPAAALCTIMNKIVALCALIMKLQQELSSTQVDSAVAAAKAVKGATEKAAGEEAEAIRMQAYSAITTAVVLAASFVGTLIPTKASTTLNEQSDEFSRLEKMDKIAAQKPKNIEMEEINNVQAPEDPDVAAIRRRDFQEMKTWDEDRVEAAIQKIGSDTERADLRQDLSDRMQRAARGMETAQSSATRTTQMINMGEQFAQNIVTGGFKFPEAAHKAEAGVQQGISSIANLSEQIANSAKDSALQSEAKEADKMESTIQGIHSAMQQSTQSQ